MGCHAFRVVRPSLSKIINLCKSLAALGLVCCVRAFSSCGERELLLSVAMHGLPTAVVSPAAEQGPWGTALVTSQLVGSSQARDRAWVPWTTREVPDVTLMYRMLCLVPSHTLPQPWQPRYAAWLPATCGHTWPCHWLSAWAPPPRSRGFLWPVGTTLLGVRGAAGEGSPILNWGSDCSLSTHSVPAASTCKSPGLCSASTSLADAAALQAWLASRLTGHGTEIEATVLPQLLRPCLHSQRRPDMASASAILSRAPVPAGCPRGDRPAPKGSATPAQGGLTAERRQLRLWPPRLPPGSSRSPRAPRVLAVALGAPTPCDPLLCPSRASHSESRGPTLPSAPGECLCSRRVSKVQFKNSV